MFFPLFGLPCNIWYFFFCYYKQNWWFTLVVSMLMFEVWSFFHSSMLDQKKLIAICLSLRFHCHYLFFLPIDFLMIYYKCFLLFFPFNFISKLKWNVCDWTVCFSLKLTVNSQNYYFYKFWWGLGIYMPWSAGWEGVRRKYF